MFDYFKNILTVLVMALPPWIAIISNMKKKMVRKRRNTILAFSALYIWISSFTNNILPTIITLIYLYYVMTKKDSDEKYYLRPLEKKIYSFDFKGNKHNIIIAKDRINVILGSIVFRVITTVISYWFIVLLSSRGLDVKDQVIVGEVLSSSGLKLVYLVILIIVTAPILEEFIFRHMFYRILKYKTGKFMSALISSVLFTLFHYYIEGVITFFLLGMYNSYLYERYGYRASVLNHTVFNMISLFYMLYLKMI